MSRQPLILCAALCLAVCPPLQADDAVAFQPAELDALIEQAVPVQAGSVEILLRKIRLEAEIVSLPTAKHNQYLLDTLRNFGVDPLPAVTHGMDIQSAAGKTLNVYVEDTVAGRVAQELKPGRKAVFYGYHVYTSNHGPGILISGFEPVSAVQGWMKRFVRWCGQIARPWRDGATQNAGSENTLGHVPKPAI